MQKGFSSDTSLDELEEFFGDKGKVIKFISFVLFLIIFKYIFIQ